MEPMESIQKVNRQQRLAEWSRRVEACRSSGLTVVQWCQENGIAVSTYFSWQRKVFQALKEVQCKNRHPSPICTRFEHHLAGVLAPLSRTEAPKPYNWFSTAKL